MAAISVKFNMACCLAGIGAVLVAGIFTLPVQAASAPGIVAAGENLDQPGDGAVRQTLPGVEAAVAFECPQAGAGGNSARLSASMGVAGLVKDAEPAEVKEQFGAIVAKMRADNSDPDVIVDTLVAAYCPLVASERDLTVAEKKARVRAFAQQATDIAFSDPLQRAREVVVVVPLSPEALRKVDQAARRGEVSRDTWLTRAIEKSLPAAP